MIRSPLALVSCVALLLAAPAAHADNIALAGEPYTGRLQYNFIGATLVDSTGLENGVNCIYRQATATLRASDLPQKPRIRSVVLYVGGSLLGNDGPDYTDLEIFDTQGVSVNDDLDFVTQKAREAADTSVSLVLPGSTSAVTIDSGSAPAVTVSYKSEGPEEGNVGFFMTRFDITDLVKDHGLLQGPYSVSDVLADVCFGTEAVCDQNETCDTVAESPAVGSAQGPHTNAAASFGILFILEDDALPLRTVGVFEGLEEVAGQQSSVVLNLVNSISDPAAGFLSFYALEGDLLLSSAISGHEPCGGDEYIRVNGSEDRSASAYLCLQDDDNPLGNIFNSTINTEPKASAGPTCSDGETVTCCGGDGLCGVTGVDIDRFNISPALIPGSHQVTVDYSTASDRIALGVVAVQVDVFEPTLDVDTQIRALNDINGEVQVGGSLIYSIAVSNTGNVPATDARVQMSAPANVTNFQVLSVPDGSTNLSTNGAGGDNNTGHVFVQGFDVPAGVIREIRVQMDTTCNALTHTLSPIATVSSSEITAFTVSAERVTVSGPGTGDCEGLDPNGSYGDDPTAGPQRVLRGGGGCQQAATPLAVVVALGLLAMLVRKTRGDA